VSFADARTVADAVLYEGYVLYPYRASANKNQFRFQFGVVAPRAFTDAGGTEKCTIVTSMPIEKTGDDFLVRGKMRCLHLCRRAVEQLDGDTFRTVESLDIDGHLLLTWDEAIEREIDFAVPIGERSIVPFVLPAEYSSEVVRTLSGTMVGRVARRTQFVAGEITIVCERVKDSMFKLRIAIENLTKWEDPSLDRDRALAISLLGAHVLLEVSGGRFVSLLDPPEHARGLVEECENVGAFPVLVGREGDLSTMLASPIVLYDWPTIAPESKAEFCDSTEIDELLTLRAQTLTDEEKREARATDARSAAIIDQSDGIDDESMNRLHGAVRSLRAPSLPDGGRCPASFEKGNRVRIRLGTRRRTDAQDMFLEGRIATIEEVREDFEGNGWIGVIVEDDPAAEMHRWYGRHLWFHPDEVELLETSP